MPHWTISFSAPYCGGYRVGDGVYLSPEPPLALPDPVPDGSVLFAGSAGALTPINGGLRVAPAPGTLWSMICIQGDRPLTVELLPDAGFGLPDQPGDYVLDLWTGERPTPVAIAFSVPAEEPATSQ